MHTHRLNGVVAEGNDLLPPSWPIERAKCPKCCTRKTKRVSLPCVMMHRNILEKPVVEDLASDTINDIVEDLYLQALE